MEYPVPGGSIRLETRGRAGWIIIDRHARRNALDRACIEALVDGLSALGRDPDTSCVVLAAEGTVFCGGADLKELGGGGGREGIRIYASVIEAIMGSARPVIARVQGPAAGGGVGLVAACHLAVATSSARFLTPEVKAGLFPLMVHGLITGTVGRKRAFAMDLIGHELSAGEAQGLGLVNEVVEPSELDATLDRWIETMGAIPAGTMARALEALHGTRNLDTLSRVLELQRTLNEIADSR